MHRMNGVRRVSCSIAIIALAGHVAIAVMTKRTRAASEQVEKAMADIGRYAFDYFLFTSTAATGSAGR